jgi:quaternary ammonium compound-resistance protein SugE
LKYWLYILIAACLEVCWTYSVRYAKFKEAFTKPSLHFFGDYHNTVPLVGYILFGVANIIFFSTALKHISPAVGYAAWMGLTMIGIKLIDSLYFKQPTSIGQILFMMLIVIGIVGLKKTTGS